MSDANLIIGTENWFVHAGQMPSKPAPNARQTAFYIGMQMEELAEKLEAVFGKDDRMSDYMAHVGQAFKEGRYDDQVMLSLARRPKDLLDADMDLLWVTIGGARAQGANVSEAYEAVADANWAKFPGGVVTRHPETGKVMKPEGWEPPDLTPFIHPSLRSPA